MKKGWKSIGLKVILIVIGLVVAFGIRKGLEKNYDQKQTQYEDNEIGRALQYSKPVSEDNPIRQIFEQDNPDAEVIIACEEDVTNDGKDDLVVICHIGNLTRTIIAVDSGDGEHYTYTDPIPGPIENQRIRFDNIDKEGEIEFIITGEKDGAVGYAIYRMIDGQPIDLFGEGMEDCC